MREFFRGPIFASEAARETWAPEIRTASALWQTLERESVNFRVRDSARLDVTVSQLPELSRWCIDSKLTLVVLADAIIGEGYAAAVYSRGEKGVRVAVTRNSASDWLDAWSRSDSSLIGELLGYPKCCTEFFIRTWEEQKLRDTTLSQLENSKSFAQPACSVLLRWLGVRSVPHLPCSFECSRTSQLAQEFFYLASKLGLAQEATSILRLQSLQATYSSLHGIGVVETPFFKFEFSTDPLPVKRSFVKPYTGNTAAVPPLEPSSYQDNGFSTYEAMSSAHATVLTACGSSNGVIADLGCGDGTLLAKLWLRNNLHAVEGVEFDEGKINRGRQRHPGVHFTQCFIEQWEPNSVDAALLMPGRILEMNEPKEFLETLRRVKKLIVYAYGDWTRGSASLESLCEKAGLPKPRDVVRSAAAQAGVILWS